MAERSHPVWENSCSRRCLDRYVSSRWDGMAGEEETEATGNDKSGRYKFSESIDCSRYSWLWRCGCYASMVYDRRRRYSQACIPLRWREGSYSAYELRRICWGKSIYPRLDSTRETIRVRCGRSFVCLRSCRSVLTIRIIWVEAGTYISTDSSGTTKWVCSGSSALFGIIIPL